MSRCSPNSSSQPRCRWWRSGGIHRDNCTPLFEAGTDGVAVVSAICGRDDPARNGADAQQTVQLAQALMTRRTRAAAAQPRRFPLLLVLMLHHFA